MTIVLTIFEIKGQSSLKHDIDYQENYYPVFIILKSLKAELNL